MGRDAKHWRRILGQTKGWHVPFKASDGVGGRDPVAARYFMPGIVNEVRRVVRAGYQGLEKEKAKHLRLLDAAFEAGNPLEGFKVDWAPSS